MYIYKITNNVNGKVYIGKTTRSVSIRYNEHISSAKTGSGFILSSAMRKYGISNFIVEQIEQVKDLDQLATREIFWINECRSNHRDFGYNVTSGGEGADPNTVVVTDGDISYRIDRDEFLNNRHKYTTASEGKVTCIDTTTNTNVSITVEEYRSNKDRYKHNTEGTLIVTTINGNRARIDVDEYTENKHLYNNNSEGKVYAFNTDGNSVTLSKDEYNASKQLYLRNSSNKVYVKLKSTGQRATISCDEYKTNKHLYSTCNSGKMFVVDKQNETRISIDPNQYDPDIHMKISEYNKKYGTGKKSNVSPREKVIVIDLDGNTLYISVDEYKQNKHLYRRPSEGFVYVILKSTGEKVKVTKEEYKTNKHLYNTASSGRIAVFCTIENRKRKIPKEEFNPQIHIVKPKYKYKKK